MHWKRKIGIICLVLGLALLTGCWDSKDIEEVSINVGVALDRADGEIKLEGEPPVMMLTFQNVAPKAAVGGEAQVGFRNITTTGNTQSKIVTEVALVNQGPLVGQHLKVIIISADLARYMNFNNLMNPLMRSPLIRLSSYVMITPDQAKGILEAEPGTEIPALKIRRIADNNRDSLRLLSPVTIGKIGNKLTGDRSFLLPCITKIDKELVFKGAAVISGKTKKLVGFINTEEITGIKWLKGEPGGGLFNIYNRRNKRIFAVNINEIKTRIIPHVKGDQISFDVIVTATGSLTEDWIEGADASNDEFLEELEKEAEKKMAYQIRAVLYKLQKEFQADAADFGEVLRIKYPRDFQKVKENWEETFSTVPIHVKTDLNIKNYNLLIKKK
ncbi:MAG: Ger(x)C family spore germination protein [Thermoactinomyces sp.]